MTCGSWLDVGLRAWGALSALGMFAFITLGVMAERRLREFRRSQQEQRHR